MKRVIRITSTLFLAAGVLLGFNEAQAADKKKKGKKGGKWITLFDGKLHNTLRGYRTKEFPEKS